MEFCLDILHPPCSINHLILMSLVSLLHTTQTDRMVAFTAGFSPLMAPKAVLMGAGLNKMSTPSTTRRSSPATAPQKKILATSEAKWDARYSHPVPHTNEYYLKCMLGGVLSCGLTHLAVTPLDVAKCNMQVNRSPLE